MIGNRKYAESRLVDEIFCLFNVDENFSKRPRILGYTVVVTVVEPLGTDGRGLLTFAVCHVVE